MESQRWKLFSSEQEEQSLKVLGGFVWYKGLVVVGTYDVTTSGNHVRARSLMFTHDRLILDQMFYKI